MAYINFIYIFSIFRDTVRQLGIIYTNGERARSIEARSYTLASNTFYRDVVHIVAKSATLAKWRWRFTYYKALVNNIGKY